MEGVLTGVRVLDLSSVLAGPLTGTFLAECGADVTKVEAPGGDVTRSWKLPGEAPGPISSYYEAANHGKTVVSHNLKAPEGQAWLQDSLAHTDVLLHNMKWGDLESMGLLPDRLSDAFPQLVQVRLVGFEQRPERLAYDVVVQAESGFMSMNGTPDGPGNQNAGGHDGHLGVAPNARSRARRAVSSGTLWTGRLCRGQPVGVWAHRFGQPRNPMAHAWNGSTTNGLDPPQHRPVRRHADVPRRRRRAGRGQRRPIQILVPRAGVRRAGRRPSLPDQRGT